MGLFDFLSGGSSEVPEVDMDQVRELIKLSQGVNQQDTTTPFGSVKYTDMAAPALTEAEWLESNPPPAMQAINPMARREYARSGQEHMKPYEQYLAELPQQPTGPNYADYLSEFEANYTPDMQMDVAFDPKIQSLFDKQFAPDGYDSYKDDYMDEFKYRSDPIFEKQDDRFAQSMFDRGMPLGSEYHDDAYLLKEQGQNDALTSAIRTSQGLADNAKLLDYNKIMGAFGGTQVKPTQADVMGPYNSLANMNMYNSQQKQADRSNIWNTAAMLGGAWMLKP